MLFRLLSLSLAVCLLGCSPVSDETSSGGDVAEMNIEARAKALLSRMTLEEKVGQTLQADIASVTPQQAREYNLGSVLNGGNSAPGGGKTAPAKEWIALADEYWDASTDTSDGGVGVPLLWGTDAVHGHNNLQNAVIFPHNIGLGAANAPELISKIASVTAREVRATGQDWTFAPTLAVAQDDRWGRTYESYSENPDIVASYAGNMVKGLQGEAGSEDFLEGQKLIATAKHFVADGGTQLGIDKGDTKGDLDAIMKLHGAGYGPAIEADVQVVMASFSSINGEKMHGYKKLLTDVLKGDMGFTGFVVGDWNGHGEIPGCSPEKCVEALHAGIDMYMAPDSWKELYDNLLTAAKAGELNLQRLDDAVLRILKVKLRAGLFDAGKPSDRASSDPEILGTDDHRAVAREAVRKSLVLLKNNGAVLPLKPNQTVLVAGSGADSIQQQTGGWTLNWQGTGNSNDEFMHAQTIYAGLKEAMGEAGGTAILSADGSYSEKPDVAILVYGEQPYAEFKGDLNDVVYEADNAKNLALLKKFRSENIPVVSIFLSGRPLWANHHINASDAFVAAWLPGTEGGGVADLLVAGKDGKARYDFDGRLSFSWPRFGSGEPVNGADAKDAQFPLGYGLTYGAGKNLADLPLDSGVNSAAQFNGALFSQGDATDGFRLFLGDSSNANALADALVSESLGGAVRARGIDYKAQEDAREFSWAGKGEGTVTLRSSLPVNARALPGDGTPAISLEWTVLNAANAEDANLFIECGEDCFAMLNIASLLKNLQGKSWQKTIVPLSCFNGKQFDLTKIETAIGFKTAAAVKLALHDIRYLKHSGPALACPS